MKKLDRYIGWNFIIGYVVSFCVLIGLRIIIDLFVNIDEFAELTERPELGIFGTIIHIINFYGSRVLLYFRDFAGMITVTAAAFSLGRLIRNNELIAIMASGLSLKRVLAPIVIIAVLINGFYIINQELLIPNNAENLVGKHDTLQGEGVFAIWFMSDSSGNLLCSPVYNVKTEVMTDPVIFVREKANDIYYKSVSQIRADFATYEGDGKWRLENGIVMLKPDDPLIDQNIEKPIEFFETDITPHDIPIRRRENFMDMLSSAQLSSLIEQGPKIKDLAELYAQKHDRITTPIMNIIMLLVSLPILVCRDPKMMKSAVMVSFGVTTLCFIVTFGCRMLAGETGFLRPEIWTWLPVLIFLPVAIVELDSMKT